MFSMISQLAVRGSFLYNSNSVLVINARAADLKKLHCLQLISRSALAYKLKIIYNIIMLAVDLKYSSACLRTVKFADM